MLKLPFLSTLVHRKKYISLTPYSQTDSYTIETDAEDACSKAPLLQHTREHDCLSHTFH